MNEEKAWELLEEHNKGKLKDPKNKMSEKERKNAAKIGIGSMECLPKNTVIIMFEVKYIGNTPEQDK